MNLTNLQTLLLSGASIGLGAIYGGIRSKIFASKTKTQLHYPFYALSALLALTAGYAAIEYWKEIFQSDNGFAIIIWIASLVVALGLFIITKKYLILKDVYKTSELDPIVNNFTAPADKDEIKLFGGDLNFLGNNPQEMARNTQYNDLLSMGFHRVLLLCEEPKNNIQKIRYGKILHDFKGAELRYYFPDKADLKVRGRIIKVSNVNRLLMYTRVRSGVYQAIETDMANSNGALYNSIWELVWSLAKEPSQQEMTEYKLLFLG
jgi:hypothetical protein